MSISLGTYSFLPWLRQGVANEITTADFDDSVKARVEVNVRLEAQGNKLGGGTQVVAASRSVALFGPGDIVGIDRHAIFRAEPRDWITNFEPNYLAHIEFYDEDFPWRYTPAAPDLIQGRLRPWITLLVLAEGEFENGKDIKKKPLPYIDILDPGVFPRADELWAWAHVHVNRTLASDDTEFISKDMNALIPKLQAVLSENPDLAYSRILCPRKLAEKTAYHAFLLPTFESGRRAGLGLEVGDVPATMSAWDPASRPDSQDFPYYFRWYFCTGRTGDFESLVRLLVPKPVDPRVGIREMDVQFPGSNVRGLDKAELGGILRLGGALRTPSEVPPAPPDKHETWDHPFPRPLQEDLARLIDLPDHYLVAGHPDPIIAPPLYGTWHALTKRVLTERDGTRTTTTENWIHRLNLDPRFRAPAGFGTRVIQDQQEKFMDAAWEQIGKVLEAQRRIRFGQFALLASQAWHEQHLKAMVRVNPEKALLLVAPLKKRLLTDGVTFYHAMNGSLVQPAMTSSALRRMVRPRARLVRSLPFGKVETPEQVIARVNQGEVSAAPPKIAPCAVLTADQAADQVVRRWHVDPRASDLVRETGQTPEAIAQMAGVADFVIREPGSGVVPRSGGTDSIEASRFKQALSETFEIVQLGVQAGPAVPKGRLDLDKAADDIIKALDPTRTIPKRVMAAIVVPPRIRSDINARPTEVFVEPMAYPVIDLPMYEPLAGISAELFLPNINLIEQNSITLLETNQRFIESYMVGLNHEFARELLWREYPTDQRCSTFRQFWDVRSFFNVDKLEDEVLKETLRDIPPLHKWSKDSALGTHDNRERGGDDEEELVLVIRGELLKRYPTAVIYAHRAEWQRRASGGIDNTKERRLVALTPSEEANPPRTKLLTPLYEAKVAPDIYFFGFDLTVEKARGGTGDNPVDDPGWFFVIKERPGEPRFGLDEQQQETLQVWNDLSWPKVQPGPAGSYIHIATAPASFALTLPTGPDQEKEVQYHDDVKVEWSRDMGSAELAYILFQAPVLVAVHASEMLRK
jgi:hypothetical protein